MNLNLFAEAFFDIETLPSKDPTLIGELMADITPPKNYKDQQKIQLWLDEARAELLEKLALDGITGTICAIGMAQDDGEPHALVGREELVISEFFGWCAGMETVKSDGGELGIEVCWIGHNIRNFDLRFLYQRSVVLGIPLPRSIRAALDARWMGREMRDTMLMWNPDPSRRVKLERLCRVLGIPNPKAEMDGTKVAQAFEDGQLGRIAEYSKAEIIATRACYRRLQQGAGHGR